MDNLNNLKNIMKKYVFNSVLQTSFLCCEWSRSDNKVVNTFNVFKPKSDWFQGKKQIVYNVLFPKLSRICRKVCDI